MHCSRRKMNPICKLAWLIYAATRDGERGKGGEYHCNSTLHVLFSLVDDKRITSMLIAILVAHNANLFTLSQPPSS